MLNRNCKTSFAKPEFLKKAQRANPRLYDIGCYNDNLALMLAPEFDEVIRLEKESRSKLSDLIRPLDYEKLNNLSDLFVPQREKSSAQRYFLERPQLKSSQMEDRVMLNNSQRKKQEVEDHRRNVKFSKNKMSVTACNDSLNAKTSNVNFVYVTCGKCIAMENFKENDDRQVLPKGEIKKLETEMWELKTKGTYVIGYSRRFQELALMCDRTFPEESDRVEKYIGRVPDTIHDIVKATKLKTMQEAIEFAIELMDKRIRDAALPWKTLKKMMTDKYCPRGEIKKLETEIWVEKYIGRVPDTIHDSVKATKLKTMQEAIEFAIELMDKRIRDAVKNKRKFKGTSENNQNQPQQNKRQNTGRAYAAGNSDRNIYTGPKPLCSKCDYHHEAGSESRHPMLNKENYMPWSSHLLRYAKSRPNGKLIHNSILNGPYVRRMISEPGDANRDVNVTETFHKQIDDELSEKELKQIEADNQAIQTILLGL
nr:hypothetical protein [Tanacetum cinerariifolium]